MKKIQNTQQNHFYPQHNPSQFSPCQGRGNKAFTLVELIVVVTILAILATIGFVSYSSYLTGVRDTNRLAQLVSISDGLELYRTTRDLPLPDDSVEVSINGNLIAYQGTAGANTLETIDFTKGGVDPKDGTYFSYYLTRDRKHYQLLGFLEEEASITSYNTIFTQTSAVSYNNRIPTVYGRKLGILTNNANTPIEQAGADVNITSATTGYIAHMTDTETLSGSSLQSINPKASCKRIKQLRGGSNDGVYEINPTGVLDADFDVYCDMTTDGGGWTFFMFVNDNTRNGPYFETPTGTYSVSREDTGSVYSLSSDIFSHTEMMVTLGSAVSPYTALVNVQEPIDAEEENKIIFFKYEMGHTGFNQGPGLCSGLVNFSYKDQISGDYINGGTNNACGGSWYTRTAGNASYLTLFQGGVGGNYWGSGMGGPNSWHNNGWWYLR